MARLRLSVPNAAATVAATSVLLSAIAAHASLTPSTTSRRSMAVPRSRRGVNLPPPSMLLLQAFEIRGGDGGGDASSDPGTYSYVAPHQQQPSLPMPGGPNNLPSAAATTFAPPADGGGYGADGMMGASASAPPPTTDPMHEYRETVEDRIDAWRRQQAQMQQSQSEAEAASAIDDQGRFKLFTTVSRVSVSFFFFILMWRTVHHYELADATFGAGAGRGGVRSGLVRAIVVTPLVVLFLGEMMGAILGLSGGGGVGGVGGASHATKKRLKGILNLHKAVELVMMFYNVVRMAIWPSKYVVREVYIGRTISNFFFLMQAQLYTKLSWDDVSMNKSALGDGEYVTESYYDDYTPDMGASYADESPSWQPPPQQQYQTTNYDENSTGWA